MIVLIQQCVPLLMNEQHENLRHCGYSLVMQSYLMVCSYPLFFWSKQEVLTCDAMHPVVMVAL